MLAKKFRFHGYGSLRFVYSRGKTVRTRFLSMKYIKNDRRTESRLTVVVSKKVSKRAPERNRIRRRLYESFRRRWSEITPGYDVAVTVFDSRVAKMPADEVERAVEELLKQANLLTDPSRSASR